MEALELRTKSVDELSEELVALRRGELTQHTQHRRVRKDIARVKTVINELQRAAGDS